MAKALAEREKTEGSAGTTMTATAATAATAVATATIGQVPVRDGDQRSLNAGVLTLLIADPDQDSAATLLQQLAQHRVDMVACADGAEALLQIGALRPDIVLISADLPLLDSATFVRVLRRRHAIPVLVGIGACDAADARNLLAAGTSACIARPYRLQSCCRFCRPASPTPPSPPPNRPYSKSARSSSTPPATRSACTASRCTCPCGSSSFCSTS